MLIKSYEVIVSISVRQKRQFIIKKLLISKVTVLPPQSKTMILLVLVLVSDDHDFLFHPAI